MQCNQIEINFNDPNEYPTGNPLDNYLDYQLFYAITSDEVNHPLTFANKCLDYYQGGSDIHEMEFYLDEAQNLIDVELTNHPGKLLKLVEMDHFDETKIILSKVQHKIGMKMDNIIGNRIRRPENDAYPININIIE